MLLQQLNKARQDKDLLESRLLEDRRQFSPGPYGRFLYCGG